MPLIIPDVYPKQGPDGSAALATFGFAGAVGTGTFRDGAAGLGFAVAGTQRASFTTAGHFLPFANNTYDCGENINAGTVLRWRNGSFAGQLSVAAGSLAAPAILGNDQGTGSAGQEGIFFANNTVALGLGGARSVMARYDGAHYSLSLGSDMVWAFSSTTSSDGTPDLFGRRIGAAELGHGKAAADDADGAAQTISAPAGGTVSAGTTGRAGAAFTFKAGAGSAAKAGSGANGGVGGNVVLQVGAGGAGDGAGVAGATGVVSIPTIVNGAAAQVGTLTNAPSAGNPAEWVKVLIAGNVRYFPVWA